VIQHEKRTLHNLEEELRAGLNYLSGDEDERMGKQEDMSRWN
jgi:hypothetical protein